MTTMPQRPDDGEPEAADDARRVAARLPVFAEQHLAERRHYRQLLAKHVDEALAIAALAQALGDTTTCSMRRPGHGAGDVGALLSSGLASS